MASNQLTLKQKVELIKASESSNQCALARQFKVSRGTVQNILKRKTELMEAYDNNESSHQKRFRTCKFNEINKLVWEWFKRTRAAKLPVSGPLIQEKAAKFAVELKIEDFKASVGWLTKWKTRHSVTFGSVSGKGGTVENSQVSDWKTKLQHLTKGYEPRNRFNLDEAGLVFEGLPVPDKTMRIKGEDCQAIGHS